MGGFGSAVLEALSDQDLLALPTRVLGLPDQYIEQGPQDLLRARYGLTAEGHLRGSQSLAGSRLKLGVESRALSMFITRRKTKQVRVGRVPIGGGAPVVVQSMTTPDTADVKATVAQIHELEQVGMRDRPRDGEHAGSRRRAPGDQIPDHDSPDRRHSFRSPVSAKSGAGGGLRADQSRQYRRLVEGRGSRESRARAEYSSAHRGQRRLAGAGTAGQVRISDRRGPRANLLSMPSMPSKTSALPI